jgi:hypothetical protein
MFKSPCFGSILLIAQIISLTFETEGKGCRSAKEWSSSTRVLREAGDIRKRSRKNVLSSSG